MSDLRVPMPDVNTLVAAAWPNHIHHHAARMWLEEETNDGWATCPIVQSGFVRISMNAAVVSREIDFASAVALLRTYTSDPRHVFWNAEESPLAWPSWLRDRIQGYRQVTDATLLATTTTMNGILVTLDSGVLSLIPKNQRYRAHVIDPV